jgi:hypothetical protein
MADSNFDSFRDFMVKRGTSRLRNSDSHFPEDESGRSLNRHWFEKKIQNGDEVRGAWMYFSPPPPKMYISASVVRRL